MWSSCARLNIHIQLVQGRCVKNPKAKICDGCFTYNLLPEKTHRTSSESLAEKCARLSGQIGGRKD